MTPDEAKRRLEALRAKTTMPLNTPTAPLAAAGALYRSRDPKAHVSIRIDADVLDAFKAKGKGWQRLVNDVLRANMPS